MRLIHAADIHLDSPMRGLARYEGAPVDKLRLATRVALANLVDLAIEEEVDALLIAGDVFDGDWLDYGTGARFGREMARLGEAGIPVVAISGNHDAASRITKSLRTPDNYRLLSVERPETAIYEDLGLAVHGQGFARAEVFDDLSQHYPAAAEGYLNVGLLHTSADGRAGHEPYAPCHPERLAQLGYDYWALGHVHGHEVLAETPPIVFSGCLQGRHAREPGAKGAVVLDIEDRSVSMSFRVLDDVRWAVCEVDASGAEDETEVYTRLAAALRPLDEASEGRLLALRVEVTGATEASSALSRDPERMRHECALLAAEAIHSSEVWIERAVVRSPAPLKISPDGDDAYAELAQVLASAGDGETRLAALAEELRPLAGKLPGALKADFDPEDPATIRRILDEVEKTLPTRLLREAA